MVSMGRRVAEVNRHASAEDRNELQAWLQSHGLPNAREIPAGSVFVVDEAAQTISVDKWVRDGNGKLMVIGYEMVTETATVPLPPGGLEFPKCCHVRWEYDRQAEQLLTGQEA